MMRKTHKIVFLFHFEHYNKRSLIYQHIFLNSSANIKLITEFFLSFYSVKIEYLLFLHYIKKVFKLNIKYFEK